MNDELIVLLGGRRAGILTPSGFTYDDDYRSAPGAIPLSLSMPVTWCRKVLARS